MMCGSTLALALTAEVELQRRTNAQGAAPVVARVVDHDRVENRKRVVRYDVVSHGEQEIYRSNGHLLGEVNLPSDGAFISVVEVLQSPAGPELRLVVLDLRGHVVRVVPQRGDRGIREHTWCCAPGHVALIMGAVDEPHTFTPESASVIDIRTGVERHLQGIWRPQQIYWAVFDSSLYVKGAPSQAARGVPGAQWPVYRYHVPSGSVSATTHHGVFFSPDGNYYFDPVPSEFRVYRAADDQDVTAALRLPRQQVRWGPQGGWMPGADHALTFVEQPVQPEHKPGQPREPVRPADPNVPSAFPERWNLVVDVETGRVIDRFRGNVGGWKTNAPALPVERRTGVELFQPHRP